MIGSLLAGIGETMLRPASLFSDSFRQREVLEETEHRPWPLPDRPWVMGQSWIDLAFMHWPVPVEALGPVVPPELRLETHDGSAWVGVTPFAVHGLRLRGTAPAPLVSQFPEVNVRTYVTVGGRPGIYFLSLDADSCSAVHAARRTYRLPYFKSEISMRQRGDSIEFDGERVDDSGPPAALEVSYSATGAPRRPRAGSFEHWATERYCLYTLDEAHHVHRAEIHHPPWPLRPGQAEIALNTMATPHGVLLEGEPVVHLSSLQDVALWPLRPVD